MFAYEDDNIEPIDNSNGEGRGRLVVSVFPSSCCARTLSYNPSIAATSSRQHFWTRLSAGMYMHAAYTTVVSLLAGCTAIGG
jgi:hypothetical protein